MSIKVLHKANLHTVKSLRAFNCTKKRSSKCDHYQY